MNKKITLTLLLATFAVCSYATDFSKTALAYIKAHPTEFNLSSQDIADLKVTDQYTDDYSGITHIWFQQSVNGIGLKNSSIALHLNQKGEVAHLTSNGILDFKSKVNTVSASLKYGDALNIVAKDLGFTDKVDAVVSTKVNDNQLKLKSITNLSDEEITVTKLFYNDFENNKYILAWEVYIEEPIRHEHVWVYMIDANTGKILNKRDNVIHCKMPSNIYSAVSDNTDTELRVDNSAVDNSSANALAPGYRVYPYFVESPSFGTRQLISGVEDATASPRGWHDTNGLGGTGGAAYTITRGNNVNAYQDKDANNAVDAGSQPDGTAALNFDFPLDLTKRMDTLDNAKATVTQLFYMNNIMHDITYKYGFTEAAGNFQSNNYGRGGAQADFVAAEAHDGSGTNNANFSTPNDGSRPRMQMYLWSPRRDSISFTVNTPVSIAGEYRVGAAYFGPCNYTLTGQVVKAKPDSACGPLTNAAQVAGKIAMIDRGTCTFYDKVKNAQNAGAIGVIIVNRPGSGDTIFGMTGAGNPDAITIPAMGVSYNTGQILKAQLANNLNVTFFSTSSAPSCYPIDGDLDNGIIAHEYTHGISNRLTGGPSNTSCLINAEQGGEGWSDFLALVLTHRAGDNKNNRKPIGTYAFGQDPVGDGIRVYPYSYDMSIDPWTYGALDTIADANGTLAGAPESHTLGEVWCTALWDMYWNLVDKHGYSSNLYTGNAGNNRALRLVMEGMKYQPCLPGFIDGRNAILKADSILYGKADYCEIWSAFARRGMGASARQGSSLNGRDQTEAFNIPAGVCNIPVTPKFGANKFTVCPGESITFRDSSLGSPTSWLWRFGDGTTSTSQNPTKSYTTAGTYSVKLIVSNGTSTDSLTKTNFITVNPNATIALTSAVGTNIQSKCIGTAITNITYTVAGGGTSAGVTGLPTGVTGTFAGGVFTISGTPSVSGTFNYTITTTGTCAQTTATGSITVTPNATLSLSSAAGTNTQSKCVGTAITNITYAVGGGATSATATGLPTGVTGSFAGGVFTISGTPSVTGTFNYTVTTTGTCTQTNLSGTITVTPNATISLSSAAGTNTQTKCVGTAITNIAYAVGGGGTSAGVTGLPTGVTGTFAGGVFTISGTPSVIGTFNYTVTTTGTCTQNSLSGSITVTPNATLSLSSAAGTNVQSKCVNTAITNITYAVGGGATSASATGLPTGVTGSFAGGVFTISGTPSVEGTFPYTVNTTGTCTQTSLSGTITVTSCGCANAPTVSLNGTSSNTCGTTAVTVAGNTFGGSATNVSLSENGAGSLNINSATTSPFSFTYTPASGDIGNTVTVTVTTNNPNGSPCVAGSTTYTINVRADGTVALTSTAGTNAQTKCVGTAITNITYAVGGSSTGGSVTGLPTGVTGSFAGGVVTISGTPSVTGTFNYTVNTSGSPCSNPSATGSITVSPNASIALTSALGTSGQTKCVGEAITNITYAVGGGATSATAVGLPNGVTGSFAGGVFTISGAPAVGGTYNYTVNTTGTCTQTSASGSIAVDDVPPTPTISQNAGTDTIRTDAVGTTYTWYYNGSTTPIATTSVPYYEFATQTGSYTVKVTSGGCTSALSASFTPTPPTGIKNTTNSVKLFEVYPNPTEGRLVLNLNLYKTSSVNISIYTPEGREVYTKGYGNTKALTDELNVNELSKGVYIIKLRVDEEIYYHKVVKN